MKPISNDIIIIGLQAWDIAIGSNCKNIALELSRHSRVFYVNTPLDRRTLWKNKDKPDVARRIRMNKGLQPRVEKIQDNLWTFYPSCVLESINWIKPHGLFSIFNRINNQRFAWQIQSLIEEFSIRDFILFNDNSIYLGYYQKQLLKPSYYLYYIRDNLTKNNYWGYHASKMEHLLIAKADRVVTNSVYYANYALKYNPKSYMIGQGCDFSAFSKPGPVPDDIARCKHPVIGYVGHLSHRRLSLELLEMLAKNNPDWTIVLVGPEDDMFKSSALHRLPNVVFTGAKRPEELVNYVSAFDICINPQKVNDATIGNYPRKIDEYLYLGKPTVASSTEAMEYFNDYVYLGKDASDYERLIKRAMAEDSPDLQRERTAFASTHTWERSVEEIYKIIQS
jgi:glycosyltransferase involved in cell wall biosynthesis